MGVKNFFSFCFYSHNIYNNKQLQYKGNVSTEKHNNPKTTLNIETQILQNCYKFLNYKSN